MMVVPDSNSVLAQIEEAPQSLADRAVLLIKIIVGLVAAAILIRGTRR